MARGTPGTYSLQKERVSRRKHHWGRLSDQTDLYLSRMPFLDEPVDLVVECLSSDSQFERVAEYEAELGAPLTLGTARGSWASHTTWPKVQVHRNSRDDS